MSELTVESPGAEATSSTGDTTKPIKKARARQPSASKVDADGNGIKKTPVKRAAPAPKLDADGNPIKKTPAKRGPRKKDATPAEAITEDVETGGDHEQAMNTPFTPPQESKTLKVEDSNTAKKRAVDTDDAQETPTKVNKRVKKEVEGKIPSKVFELSEADKILWTMKNAGSAYAEITPLYEAMLGKSVAKNYLKGRFQKLKASLIEWKEGDVRDCLSTISVYNI
jgi:hypothetical protein